MLDPPTADVTARVISMLAQIGETAETSVPMRRGIDYLLREQDPEGSWYGRWGMNFIYGTWSVLCALNAAGISHDAPGDPSCGSTGWSGFRTRIGGWGEDDKSYALKYPGYAPAPSTASQTSWAVLGLMAVGEVDHPAVAQGIAYLAENSGGGRFLAGRTATPRRAFRGSFYLRYHGYSKFFPVWAMARFRNLKAGNTKSVMVGM